MSGSISKALKQRSQPQPLVLIFIILHFICNSCISQQMDWTSIKKKIRKQFPTVEQLSTQELSDWLSSPDTTKPVLLDARQRNEFEVSHLQGAQLAGSEKQALEAIGDLQKSHPIVVYCSVGYRSSQLAAKLQKLGFDNVFNLEGSIFQWANEGKPVYADTSRVNQVHPYNKGWGQLLKQDLWFKLEESSK